MKLTGKCLDEFKGWYFTPQANTVIDFNTFIQLPDSMKYGVYVDYLDSIGIDIDQFDWLRIPLYGRTRQEARIKAIEKSNELRNEQL